MCLHLQRQVVLNGGRVLLRGVGDVGARPAAEQPVSHEAFRLGEVPGRDKVYVRREPNLMKMNGKEGRAK